MKRNFPIPSPPAVPGWPDPDGWQDLLADQFATPQWHKLIRFIGQERQSHEVFPAESNVFRAFQLTPPASVRFVILGQDPYHGPGQAHGLSFSVPDGIRHPPSLANIFRELVSDIGCPAPQSGDLTPWAEQGGLLLNTVLTVRAAAAHSHRKQGWEPFTDAVIRAVNDHCQHVAFVLWGRPAQTKRELIDPRRHLIIEAPHPSPLSAWRGFFGSRPFSKINAWLKSRDLAEIDWSTD